MPRWPLILALLPPLTLPQPVAAQGACAAPADPAGPSRDLYCIELLPSAIGGAAHGTAQLDWVPGPFTVSVTPDGTHRWYLRLRLAGLPPPPAGRAAGYVAWAAPPTLDRIERLGTVREGVTRLGPVAFDRFVVLVSAEPDTAAAERRGALLLRGESAGNRMRPADVYQFFLGALGPGAPPAGHLHTHSTGWRDAPMFPGIDMLPAEMALRPGVRPWVPPDAPDAPVARPREIERLASGDTLDLAAGLVRRSLAGRAFTMFGFNGQYPGPLLAVLQGAAVTVRFTNRLPLPTTVHWHGLRLDNRFDGVPEVTQPAVAPGDSFTYRLRFPDAGVYWYHPHVREDLQQDLGLYGNIFVRPARRDTWGPAHREEFLILDDLLIGDGGPVPWGDTLPTHAATGRFGNVLLVNGEPRWTLRVRRGEVVRLFLTNASSTRTFNVGLGTGARMKLVGGDLGNYAREAWIESVVIGPAERYVADVRFGDPGAIALLNRVRAIDHLYARFIAAVDTLGVVTVDSAPATPDLSAPFARLRADTATAREVAPLLRAHRGRPPDRTLELRVRFTGLPFVTEQLMRLDSAFFNPVEWAGTMPGMNLATTGAQAQWTLRDPATGLDNTAVAWTFRRGDLVRLRLVNVRGVLHGMQHPIHLHGQRFLILAVNGAPSEDPAWKDTVLVPAGGVVDLLVEMSNPGRWMAHCHIAEHLQAGMMTVFEVH